jgi:hypothetical protein
MWFFASGNQNKRCSRSLSVSLFVGVEIDLHYNGNANATYLLLGRCDLAVKSKRSVSTKTTNTTRQCLFRAHIEEPSVRQNGMSSSDVCVLQIQSRVQGTSKLVVGLTGPTHSTTESPMADLILIRTGILKDGEEWSTICR